MRSGDVMEIDFGVVAKKEDLDNLQEVVSDILDFLSKTDNPGITKTIGPAATRMLDRRDE